MFIVLFMGVICFLMVLIFVLIVVILLFIIGILVWMKFLFGYILLSVILVYLLVLLLYGLIWVIILFQMMGGIYMCKLCWFCLLFLFFFILLIGLCGVVLVEFVFVEGELQVFIEDDYISYVMVNFFDFGVFRIVLDVILFVFDDVIFFVMVLFDVCFDFVFLLFVFFDCIYIVNISINFGVFGFQYSVCGIGSYFGICIGNFIVVCYYFFQFIIGNYLKVIGFVVDCEWDVDVFYFDVDFIDFYGKVWVVFYCFDDQGNWFYKKVQNVQIFVNGVVFGFVLKFGDIVDYIYILSKGEFIIFIGLCCIYGDIFDLMVIVEFFGLCNCILSVFNGFFIVINLNVNIS